MAIVLIMIVMPFYFLVSCGGEKKEMVEVTFDPETSYTLKETNVNTLVSDSGITRYKVITDTWLMFDKASEPYWYFPDGVYLEKFDTAFNIEASIRADTARYFQRRGLWQADGHVDISNTEGVRLETSQLFWDEKKETIYSDSFVKITKGEDVNTGIGFLSNKDMSEYTIYNSTANFAVEMQRHQQGTDSIPADSTDRETNTLPIPENASDTIHPAGNSLLLEVKEKDKADSS
ncbi:MAG: LPS export ABC transporter periplasmic protein LptC [Tannerella sp.]|nr:LPS export ABC transporter periplasmic protein LptC [Tannerella sp.]